MSTHAFVDIAKQKTCPTFQQKILNSLVVEARQSFQLFRQKTWILGNNGGLPKYRYQISNKLISATKL